MDIYIYIYILSEGVESLHTRNNLLDMFVTYQLNTCFCDICHAILPFCTFLVCSAPCDFSIYLFAFCVIWLLVGMVAVEMMVVVKVEVETFYVPHVPHVPHVVGSLSLASPK